MKLGGEYSVMQTHGWQNADEKVSVVLKDQIGASSQSDLSFLDTADSKLLVGKLTLVQLTA
jgi:hypothetical protein